MISFILSIIWSIFCYLQALYIIDNQNLQDLLDFGPQRPALEIAKPKPGKPKGKVGFHFNPHLCRGKIDTLVRKINASMGVDDYDDRDISKISNGDRAACDIKTLKLNVVTVKANYAVLSWEEFILPDSRALLG